MGNIKEIPSYTIEMTADGSPSMRLFGGESMHSLDGALSETLYIYGPTIEAALQEPQPALLSLGLGLGYNELAIAAFAIQHQIVDLKILSFESVQWLSDSFIAWLKDEDSELAPTYQQILSALANTLKVEGKDIKNKTLELLQNKNLIIKGALQLPLPDAFLCQGILFDAFSMKSSPELWSEEFLDLFFKNYCQPTCYFSTYAATGNLNRALRLHHFMIEKKSGFGRKRESTFARRTSASGLE